MTYYKALDTLGLQEPLTKRNLETAMNCIYSLRKYILGLFSQSKDVKDLLDKEIMLPYYKAYKYLSRIFSKCGDISFVLIKFASDSKKTSLDLENYRKAKIKIIEDARYYDFSSSNYIDAEIYDMIQEEFKNEDFIASYFKESKTKEEIEDIFNIEMTLFCYHLKNVEEKCYKKNFIEKTQIPERITDYRNVNNFTTQLYRIRAQYSPKYIFYQKLDRIMEKYVKWNPQDDYPEGQKIPKIIFNKKEEAINKAELNFFKNTDIILEEMKQNFSVYDNYENKLINMIKIIANISDRYLIESIVKLYKEFYQLKTIESLYYIGKKLESLEILIEELKNKERIIESYQSPNISNIYIMKNPNVEGKEKSVFAIIKVTDLKKETDYIEVIGGTLDFGIQKSCVSGIKKTYITRKLLEENYTPLEKYLESCQFIGKRSIFSGSILLYTNGCTSIIGDTSNWYISIGNYSNETINVIDPRFNIYSNIDVLKEEIVHCFKNYDSNKKEKQKLKTK